MGSQSLFLKRYERKYLFDEETYELFMKLVGDAFVPDIFPKSHIFNIYFDTPDFLLIRRSIEKPFFKEKLRLRTYEPPKNSSESFCEIKRKVNKIVYKRRISMDYLSSYKYLVDREDIAQPSQISREIDHMFDLYSGLRPAMKVSYERESYASSDPDSPLRMTFDRNIRWDTEDFGYRGEFEGNRLLPEGLVLLELKTGESIPLEMLKVFDELNIRKASFSKYGNAYRQYNRYKLPLDILVSGVNAGKKKSEK